MTGKGLAKLIEECGELIAVAGKRLSYYHTDIHPDGGGSLSRRLEDEIADVLAACAMVTSLHGLDRARLDERWYRKSELFMRWNADPDNNTQGIDIPQSTPKPSEQLGDTKEPHEEPECSDSLLCGCARCERLRKGCDGEG